MKRFIGRTLQVMETEKPYGRTILPETLLENGQKDIPITGDAGPFDAARGKRTKTPFYQLQKQLHTHPRTDESFFQSRGCLI